MYAPRGHVYEPRIHFWAPFFLAGTPVTPPSAEALLSAPALCRQTTSHLTEDCVRRQSSCCCPIRSYTVPAQLRLLWRRDQCAEALKNPRETTQKDACWDALARSEPAVGSPTYALPAGSSQAGGHSSHLFDKSTTANSHQHRCFGMGSLQEPLWKNELNIYITEKLFPNWDKVKQQ
jgi:hypothetical protein